jgi:hypothetical protein
VSAGRRVVLYDGGGEPLFGDRLQQHLRGQPVRVITDLQTVILLILWIFDDGLDTRKP